MFNERNNVRYLTHGRARIPGFFESETLLKDLSVSGCCLELPEKISLSDVEILKIEIIPEPEADVPVFTVSAEPRWVRSASYSFAVGFQFVSVLKGKELQKYLKFLGAATGPR